MLVVALAAAAAGVALGHGLTRADAHPSAPSRAAVVAARNDARAATPPDIGVSTPAVRAVEQLPSNIAAPVASAPISLPRQRALPAPAATQRLHSRVPAAVAGRFDPTDPYD